MTPTAVLDVEAGHTEAVTRLSRDLVASARTLTDREARYLVDYYYLSQEDRKRAHNQERALGESAEPCQVVGWLADQSAVLERQIKRALEAYARAHVMGDWMFDIKGIGPVITAGLLAHLSVEPWKCAHGRELVDKGKHPCREATPCGPECRRVVIPTAGHWWSYAGLNPEAKWEKGKIRPWNAKLKVLCWKAGQSFMKTAGDDDAYYGKVYQARKAYEQAQNDAGVYADQARSGAERVKPVTDAYAWYAGRYPAGTTGKYAALSAAELRAKRLEAARLKLAHDLTGLTGDDLEKEIKKEASRVEAEEKVELLKTARVKPGEGQPMLPPAQIDARARRYAVKAFLADMHAEWYRRHFGQEPPKPYAIAILGHAHERRA